MHDLGYFREHLDVFAEMAKRRSMTLDLDGFRALDKQRRELITTNEQRKSQRNRASDEIAKLKKAKQDAEPLIAEMKDVSELIKLTDTGKAVDARKALKLRLEQSNLQKCNDRCCTPFNLP